MVDASSRLPKHALSYDRLGRATARYFESDDSGNTQRMRCKSLRVPRRSQASRRARRQEMATVPMFRLKMVTVPILHSPILSPFSHFRRPVLRKGLENLPTLAPRKSQENQWPPLHPGRRPRPYHRPPIHLRPRPGRNDGRAASNSPGRSVLAGERLTSPARSAGSRLTAPDSATEMWAKACAERKRRTLRPPHKSSIFSGIPNGIRTRVAGVKSRCPRPD